MMDLNRKKSPEVKIATFHQRILAYIIDISVLICISSFILFPLHKSFGLFDILETYSYGLSDISASYITNLLISVIIFIAISYVYFFFEIYGNLSVGNKLSRIRTVLLKTDKNSYLIPVLIRSAVKAFPISNLADSLWLLRKKSKPQKLTEQHFGVYLINTGKNHLSDYLIMSLILYYLPLMTVFIITILSGDHISTVTSQSLNSSQNMDFHQLSAIIANNNFSFDLQLELGGIFLLIPTFFIIYTSSLLEGSVMGLAYLSSKVTLEHKVLPQFFPETMAYVFGITFAICLTIILASFIESYIRGVEYAVFERIWKQQLIRMVFLFSISLILILIAASIESAILT